MPSSKKLKVESSTVVVSPYKPGALSLWLQTSSSLGGVEPVEPPLKSGEGEDEDEDDDEEDDDDDDASEDERLLQLRRLEDGTDWMALYEKIMREGDGEEGKDDDDEEDNDNEYDEGVKKPSINKKNEKKPMAVKKAAQAAAKAGALHSSAAKAGALHTTAPSAAIRAGGVAPQSDAAANVAILPRNSSTSLQKKQQQSAPSLLQPTLAVEKKATRATEESTSSSSSLSSHGGAGGAKRPRSADETATEKKEKRELPKPFIPTNPAGCVFLSNIPEGTPPEEISKLLSSSFGKVRTVHYEKSNQGKDCTFGYVEFESQTSVKAAVASTAIAPSISGRTLKLDLFTPESNYRNADGSRRRNKKENKKKEKLVEQQHQSETFGGKKARGLKTTK